jgi:hypothetical protein
MSPDENRDDHNHVRATPLVDLGAKGNNATRWHPRMTGSKSTGRTDVRVSQ